MVGGDFNHCQQWQFTQLPQEASSFSFKVNWKSNTQQYVRVIRGNKPADQHFLNLFHCPLAGGNAQLILHGPDESWLYNELDSEGRYLKLWPDNSTISINPLGCVTRTCKGEPICRTFTFNNLPPDPSQYNINVTYRSDFPRHLRGNNFTNSIQNFKSGGQTSVSFNQCFQKGSYGQATISLTGKQWPKVSTMQIQPLNCVTRTCKGEPICRNFTFNGLPTQASRYNINIKYNSDFPRHLRGRSLTNTLQGEKQQGTTSINFNQCFQKGSYGTATLTLTG